MHRIESLRKRFFAFKKRKRERRERAGNSPLQFSRSVPEYENFCFPRIIGMKTARPCLENELPGPTVRAICLAVLLAICAGRSNRSIRRGGER